VLLDGFPDVIFGCEPTGRENESGNAMKLLDRPRQTLIRGCCCSFSPCVSVSAAKVGLPGEECAQGIHSTVHSRRVRECGICHGILAMLALVDSHQGSCQSG